MVIEEKYSRFWIQITATLASGAFLFFIGYNNISDVLWKGILRLVAFGFLAGTVFSTLKVLQGKHSIYIETKEENLILTYYRNDEVISRDIFELDSIDQLYCEPHTGFIGESFLLEDLNIKFIPTDSDRALNLVEVHGRALALAKKDAHQLLDYIARNASNARIVKS